MVSTQRIKEGLVAYVDNEILPHMTGFRKIGMGAYVALASERIEETIQKYAGHPAIEMLGIVQNGEVDVDRLMSALADNFGDRQTMSIPLFGDFTFERRDLDKLRDYIGR